MTKLFPALAGLILAAASSAIPAAGADPRPDLDSLQWVARPLVVFADTPDDPKFIQQMSWLEADPEPLAERLVVVLTDASPAENGALRQQLRPRGFGLVLIDTDGRVAHRRPLPATVREITNMIDRMPSRRQESGSRRP